MDSRGNKTLVLVEAVTGTFLWLFSAYRLITGARQMSLADAMCAGMILVLGPALIWELVQKLNGTTPLQPGCKAIRAAITLRLGAVSESASH